MFIIKESAPFRMESAHRYFRIGAPLILEWTHQSTGICRPVYNGNGFTPGKYDTEEEELLVWSLTCLQAPLNNQAYERYKELFCRLLPEKAKILFPEMNENNQAKVA